MHRKAVAIICLGLVALPASAQVHRCNDVTGKTVYSDKPCETGQKGGQIERQRTREEIYQERVQAYDAEKRKQQRNVAEQERESASQYGRALQNQNNQAVQQPGNDWASRKARENAATSAGSIANSGGKWDAAAEAQREQARKAEASRRPRPSTLSQCFGTTCTDNAGNTYYKTPSIPNQMTRSDGKTCIRTGDIWNCN